MHMFLASVGFLLLIAAALIYGLLDGYELGLGVLSLIVQDPDSRQLIFESMSEKWQARELWLLMSGAIMLAGFPLAVDMIRPFALMPAALLAVGLLLRYILKQGSGLALSLQHQRAYGFSSLLSVIALGWLLGVFSGALGYRSPHPGMEILTVNLHILFLVMAFCLILCLQMGSSFLLRIARPALHEQMKLYSRIFTLLSLVAIVLLLGVVYLEHFVADMGAPPAVITARVVLFMVLLIALLDMAFMRVSRHQGSVLPFMISLCTVLVAAVAMVWCVYPQLIPGVIGVAQAAASDMVLIYVIAIAGVLLPVLLTYNSMRLSFLFRSQRYHDRTPGG